jgi:hypothetical protein
VLELRLDTAALSTLGPITVNWELQSLVLEVDGTDDACHDFAETQARKSNLNNFVISLLVAESSFKTLRDIKLRFEHLTPDMYSSQDDPEVLTALSSLSRDRQLGDLELTQFELACCNRVLFDLLGFGFSLTPSLRVLEIEMAILTERSAWTITDNCPNLQRVAIGAHCNCEVIRGEYLLPVVAGTGGSRYGTDGHVIRRLVNDLASLNTMKLKNCTDASFTGGFCGACNCHKLAILLGPSEWDSSSVRLLELDGFEREQSDEARTLIPSHIDLMYDGELIPPRQ